MEDGEASVSSSSGTSENGSDDEEGGEEEEEKELERNASAACEFGYEICGGREKLLG